MKRFLLLICALPYLINAQNVTLNYLLKEKTFVQYILKSHSIEKINQVNTYAAEVKDLLDSIYIYSNEAKTDLTGKIYYTYNADGYLTLERRISFWDIGDGLGTVNQTESKIEYTYTFNDGKVTVDEIIYYLSDDDKWIAEDKTVAVFSESNLNNYIEFYAYKFASSIDDWEMYIKAHAVEFDKGLPTVFVYEVQIYDDESGKYYWTTCRLEIYYDTNGLMTSLLLLLRLTDVPEDNWVIIQKQENFYNAEMQLIKEVISYDGGGYSFEYEYDEKGNPNSMIQKFEDDKVNEYYTNFYPSSVENELISLIQSVVFPNPVSNVLNVRIEGSGEAIIKIANMNGSKVFQQKTSQTIITIPVEQFAKGYYILTIEVGNKVKTHKVIIK